MKAIQNKNLKIQYFKSTFIHQKEILAFKFFYSNGLFLKSL